MSDQTAEPAALDVNVEAQTIVDLLAGQVGQMSIELAIQRATNARLTELIAETEQARAELARQVQVLDAGLLDATVRAS